VALVTEIRNNHRMSIMRPTRRHIIASLGSVLAAPAIVGRAVAEDFVNPFDFGLQSDMEDDQTAAIQAAIDQAANFGKDVLFPSGEYYVTNLRFHGNTRYIGNSGGTYLQSWEDGPVASAGSGSHMVIDGITFGGGAGGATIFLLEETENATFRDCGFDNGGIAIEGRSASAMIENCRFGFQQDAAIHSLNSRGGMFVRSNRISDSGNAGIRIWRDDEARHDGSIVSGNSISRVDWRGGGNGQNGNGVNVFQADDVIVSDNVISDCAFTAVRVNAGRNTQVRGNTCLNSGEVAIFSEFGFSGSVIADNIIDGAATGIDITNFDTGGHLATCTGNIVRNIYPSSVVNPDTRPVGIYAEAETVVANNTIEAVPGIGIVGGYGTFLRNVVISDNVFYAVHIGIGVSVVQDPSPGHVSITGNVVSDPLDYGIVGLEWEKIVSDDLARDAANYPHVTIANNTITAI
jgi:uncharacterized secreted repeat protein (TIGR03808 family)